jgi:hypothetical protein
MLDTFCEEFKWYSISLSIKSAETLETSLVAMSPKPAETLETSLVAM